MQYFEPMPLMTLPISSARRFKPSIEPKAYAVAVNLVDVGDLINRVTALTEQDGVSAHSLSLRRW
jgi:hypothetical protein